MPVLPALVLAANLVMAALPTPAGDLENYIYVRTKPEFGHARAVQKAKVYGPMIREKSAKYGLKPQLLASLIAHESNFDPREISPVGAKGLGQIMPMWFKTFKIPAHKQLDPRTNLEISAKLLRGYRDRVEKKFPGLDPNQVDHRTLISYNMGFGRMQKLASRGIYRSRYSKSVIQEARKIGAGSRSGRP